MQIGQSRSNHLSKSIISKINNDDYVHKVFLKPFQIGLKTPQKNDTASIGDLPKGLFQALKTNISQNCYQSADFVPIQSNHSYQQTKQQNADNLISYLKSMKHESDDKNGVELLICVCMYSENKQMLKDSIKGIEQNIIGLINKGMNPDSIGIILMMDGIQKINESIIDYTQQLQSQSYINLTNNTTSYTIHDIQLQIKQNIQNQQNYTQKFFQKSTNNFLFTQPQLQDRYSRRFQSIYKDYMQLKKIKNILQKLKINKNQQNLYDKLPQKIKKQFYYKQAKQYLIKKNKKLGIIHPIQQPQIQNLIQQLNMDPKISKIIATQSINKALIYINKYLQTRQQLSYLASFRKKIYLHPNSSQNNQYQLVQQNQNIIRYMNLFMCVKYKNAGKLSSHNWFFNGFCKQLNPKFTILMDVGLKPQKQSICKMYYSMRDNPDIGGVCGYMRLKIEQIQQQDEIKQQQVDWLSSFTLNFVDIQKAQQMQYNFAHIIDKPFQSSFKFIHVLPGAFSGYSMQALTSKDGDKLLKQYFKSIEDKIVQNNVRISDITLLSVLLRILLPQFLFNLFYGVEEYSQEEMLYNQNIYFAQDRILCMEIHQNRKELIYLPDAFAEVDPIKTVHGLMGQRKRWINGSYFAFQKVKKRIQGCDLALRLQVLFYDFLNIFIYFAPSIFFFTIHISMIAFRADVLDQILQPIQVSSKTNDQLLNFFVYTIDLIYAMLMATIIYYSLNTTSNKPIYKPYIYFVSTILGVLAIAVLIVFLVDIIRGLTTGTLFLLQGTDNLQSTAFKILLQINRWIVVGVFGIYIIPLLYYSILFKSFRPIIQSLKGAISFVFYNPTYLILLNFYALCRIDDISWGTKGLNTQNVKQTSIQQKWKLIKLIHVGKYVFWNIVGSVLLLTYSQLTYPRFYIAFVIMISIVLTMSFKIIIGFIYLITYKCKSICVKQDENKEMKKSELERFIQKYKNDLQSNVLKRVGYFKEEVNNSKSFIIGLSKLKTNKKILQNDMNSFKREADGRSNIIRQRSMNPGRKNNLKPIEQVKE